MFSVTVRLITKHVVGLGLGEGVMKIISINKLTSIGCEVKIWIADWFAQLNNKMGGDLKKIQTVGQYTIEICKVVGLNLQGDSGILWSSVWHYNSNLSQSVFFYINSQLISPCVLKNKKGGGNFLKKTPLNVIKKGSVFWQTDVINTSYVNCDGKVSRCQRLRHF